MGERDRERDRERGRARGGGEGEGEGQSEGEIFIATIDCAQLNYENYKSYMYFGLKIVEGAALYYVMSEGSPP